MESVKATCDIVECVLSLNKAEARVRQLEHWFNGYKTPEMSMTAMMERVTELEGKLRNIHNASLPDPFDERSISLSWLVSVISKNT